MKQTNGAVTLLLSAFKSIYRNAYVKGIASAVVLTAGLSAGAANAASDTLDANAWNNELKASQAVTVDGKDEATASATDGHYTNIQIAGAASTDEAFNITITSGAFTANYISGDGSTDVTVGGKNGTLTIDIAGEANATASLGKGLLVGDSGSVTLGTINVNRGTLQVKGDTNAASLTAKIINIGNGTRQVNDIDSAIEVGGADGTELGAFGATGNHTDFENSSVITIKNDGQLVFKGSSDGTEATVNAGILTIDGGTLKTDAQSGGTVNLVRGSMTGGNFTVTSGSTVNFNFKDVSGGTAADPVDAMANSFTVNSGTMDITGNLVISGDSTVTTNGDAVFAIGDDVKLNAYNASTAATGSKITVSGDAVLQLSTDKVKEYVTAGADRDTDKDAAGKFVINTGAVEITDAEVDLDDTAIFKFSGSSISGVTGHTFELAGASNTLRLHTANLDKVINGGSGASGLYLEIEHLNLDSSSLDLDALSEYTGDAKITLSKGLNIAYDKGFTIDKATTWNTGAEAKGDAKDVTGTVSAAGDLTFSGSSAADTTVKGSWVLENGNSHAINVGTANLKVGDGSFASLAIETHELNLNSGSTIIVSGGTVTAGKDTSATLDLTEVSTLAHSGTGDATVNVYDNGVLKITNAQLETITGMSTNGIKLTASGSAASGTISVLGDADLTFDQIADTAAVGKIGVNKGGILDVDGDVSLVRNETGSTATVLSFKGEIKGDVITVSDLASKKTADDANASASEGAALQTSTATVSGGTLTASAGFTSANDSVTFSGSAATNKASLVLDAGSADATGTVTTSLVFEDNSSFAVNEGVWTAAGETLTMTNGAATFGDGFDEDNKAETPEAVFTAQTLNFTSGTVTVNKDASVIFDSLASTNATADSIKVSGSLTVNGLKTTTGEGEQAVTTYGVAYEDDSISVSNGGTFTLGATALEGLYTTAQDGSMEVNYNQVKLAQGATLRLDYAEGTTQAFDADDLVALKKALVSGATGDTASIDGTLEIGAAKITGVTDKIDATKNTIKYADVKPVMDVISDIGQDDLMQVGLVEVTNNGDVRGQYGYINGVANATSVQISDETSLNNAAAIDGHFATSAQGGTVKDLTLDVQDGSILTLRNGGIAGDVILKGNPAPDAEKASGLVIENGADGETVIGDITGTNNGSYFETNGGQTTVKGTVDVDYAVLNGATTFEKDATVEELEVNSSLVSAGEGRNQVDLTVSSLEQTASGYINTNVLTIYGDGMAAAVGGAAGANLVNEIANGDVYLAGTVEAQRAVLNDDTVIAGSFTAGQVEVDNNAAIVVGHDAIAEDTAHDIAAQPGATGYFFAGELTLKGGRLIVDPEYGTATALAGIDNFGQGIAGSDNRDIKAGTLDGEFIVGKNAALGVGFDSLDEVAQIVARYQRGGSLVEEETGSLLVINRHMTVDGTDGKVLLDAHNGTDDIVQNYNALDAAAQADMVLGSNTALVLTDNAFGGDVSDKTLEAAVYFDKADASVAGNGGEIILSGSFKAREHLNIFEDQNGSVDVINGTITVSSENGLLQKVLGGENPVATNDVVLGFNETEGRAILSGTSDPVYRYLRSYAYGLVNPDAEAADQRTLYSGKTVSAEYYAANQAALDEQGVWDEVRNDEGTVVSYAMQAQSDFLDTVISTGNGSDAESVARLAVYGGAAEVALAASSVTSDAIASRMGMGNPNGNLVMADSEKGAGLWLAPMYKNHESDNFDAQGVDYGVDLDLTGVALGADYTFGSNVRGGAMFAIGSGDADGQGAGSAVSNDFDFWSVGVYGGYAYEAFSLTADLSWTQVDNDIDANTAAAGKVSASMDADVLSAGLTAKYDLDLDMVKVAPHLGMRYTSIDIDDYSVSGIASSDVDSISVFSIPVGVMFSTDIATASGWNVKPALDLTLTVNTGDDEVDSDVRFTGVDMTTDLTSEFIDDVTYGATVGVQVQKDAFQFGLGVNYTGSDNTDEFGVGANARFTF